MFDTMVVTKAVAGFCSALLIFLLGGWVADTIYKPYGPAPVAYVIDTGVEEAPVDEAPAEQIDVMALFASADPAAGEGLWRNCRACHALEAGRNGTGPYLHGIVDRPIGAVAGFNYSGALAQLGDVWTVEALNAFIENPRGTAPGTTMSYAGMRNISDRLNLIAYMQAQSN
jgi:cytochrome c